MPIRLKLLHDWDQQLHSLLPGVRSTRVQVLALFSLGLLWAGNVTLLRIAHALPLHCSASSTERRLRRWLANSQVPVTAMLRPLVKALLSSRAGCELVLTLDPTPLGGVLTGQVYNAYVLGLVVRGRVLPLLWYIASNQQDWQVQERWVLSRLLRVVASWLPPDCSVTLVADRGLTGPELIGACEAVGWHYVLRVSCDSRQGPKLRDGSWLWELVTGPGQRLYTEVELFRSAGWIRVGLSICWGKGYDEPWILISDRSAGLCRVLEYKRRWRAEPTYQDCKRRGWDLGRTKVRDRNRLNRLLLVVFLALWWAQQLGYRVIRQGKRKQLDRSDRRELSVMRIGRAWLLRLLDQDKLPPLPFRRRHSAWYFPCLS